MSNKTGFIGLGAMGGPMALNMLKAGIPLVVHDIDATKVDALVAAGAEKATSSKAAARDCDRVICLVETTAQATDVILGEDGIIHGVEAGNIVLCMSTIDPLVAKEIASKLNEKGVQMLDAPISGGTPKAKAGTLAVIVGGEAETFGKCRDIFDAVGEHAFHIGEQGQGLVMKLINNMLGITNTIVLLEGLTIGAKSGIGLQTMYDVLKVSSGDSAAVDFRVPRIMSGDFAPGGTMDIVYKDQELITSYAKDIGVPTFMANVSQQIYQMARTAGLNKEDSSAVIKIYEQLADVSVIGRK
ncbi:MAG: NAD(P)-dependent oxidoreductase [Alphaproteobacteria bacterium]|jgi:2-hydroxymethylglutarate dehydrogenase|nr:NAD(P)-dependent oxidoreductase [Alphaproteobacteria bacterium]